MRKSVSRLAALLCAALMTVTLLPDPVWGALYETASDELSEDALLFVGETWGNPLYPELAVDEGVTFEAPVAALANEPLNDGGSYATVEDAAVYLRQQFKARENMMFFFTGYPQGGPLADLTEAEEAAPYTAAEEKLAANGTTRASILRRRMLSKYLRTLVREELLPEMFRHDPNDPSGGDYMRYQYKTVTYNAALSGDIYGITISFDYFTTAAQEAEVDQVSRYVLDFLQIEGMTDYGKVKTIYDWLCKKVSYDYGSDGTLKHSAYAALINKTAVCQGYATAFYRLALMAGVNARVVRNEGSTTLHGWNLVQVGGKWYYADTTWDAGRTSKVYFLKRCSLSDHVMCDEDVAMTGSYALSESDFSIESAAVQRGKLNRGGGAISVTDMQLLYTYLLLDTLPEGAREDGLFQLAADVNGDDRVDVYDLQALYEILSGIRK